MDERQPEEAVWAEIEARWQEEDIHRAYLARCHDLDALAAAGRRYRDALDRRPGDAVALRWRDEVVRRAAALALAQLPRTRPPRSMPAGLRTAFLALIILAVLGSIAWLFLHLPHSGADR
jgi:hypothetical protein